MSSICCPVCLGEIGDVHDERVMRMPVCGHLIHTACALSAAQYDTRCPMCRSHDPSIVVREDGSRGDVNAAFFVHVESIVSEEDERFRRYQRQRSSAIRRSESLKRLRDRIRAEVRVFRVHERELSQTWYQMQRDAWKNDTTLQALKDKRRKQQRRVTDLNRRLERRVLAYIGGDRALGPAA